MEDGGLGSFESELAARASSLAKREEAVARAEARLKEEIAAQKALLEQRGREAEDERRQRAEADARLKRRELELVARCEEVEHLARTHEVAREVLQKLSELRGVAAGTIEPREGDASGDHLEAAERELEARARELEARERELEERELALKSSSTESPAAPVQATAPGGAGRWEIADLTRLVASARGSSPDRELEWEAYVDSLSEVADAQGRLPAAVDDLVEEVFSDLLTRPVAGR